MKRPDTQQTTNINMKFVHARTQTHTYTHKSSGTNVKIAPTCQDNGKVHTNMGPEKPPL